MDIETEIRDLKLRADALEASMRSGNVTPIRLRARRRRMHFPAHNCAPPSEDLQTNITTTSMDVAELKARLDDLEAELNQDISALNDELGGFRRQTNDNLTKFRTQTHDQHDLIYRRLTDMAILVERLLKRLDA